MSSGNPNSSYWNHIYLHTRRHALKHAFTHTHSEQQIFKIKLFSFQHDQDIQHDLHVLCQGKRSLKFEQVLRKVSSQVMRHPANEPILPKQMRNVGIVFSLLIGIAAHLILSYLGCWVTFFLTKSRMSWLEATSMKYLFKPAIFFCCCQFHIISSQARDFKSEVLVFILQQSTFDSTKSSSALFFCHFTGSKSLFRPQGNQRPLSTSRESPLTGSSLPS